MTKKRNRRGIEARRKEVVWVPFVGGVVSWFLAFPCLCQCRASNGGQTVVVVKLVDC